MASRHALCPPSGHRPTLAPPSKAFSPATMRIPSQPHPLLCGYSATYKRYLCASIRQLPASMRQLCASIRRASETDPARYAARPGQSETASGEKRQIEHLKILKKGPFRPKKGPKNEPKRWQKGKKLAFGLVPKLYVGKPFFPQPPPWRRL
jgi:hypothetical protein